MGAHKILILTNRIPYPLKDGGNMAMQAMIEGYHRSGWQVYLLSMNTSRHFIPHDQLRQLFTHLHGFDWVDVNNDFKPLDIIRNFLFSNEPEHAVRFNKEEFRTRLKEVLISFQPDVVQVESVYLTNYLHEIRALTNALTILRVHNVEYQIWRGVASRVGNPLKRIYFSNLADRIRKYERAAWKEYDLLLPITEKDAHLINRLEDINNNVVAPFSIDCDSVRNDSQQEQWVGYHIGAMDWIANRDGIRWFLEKAWPLVHRAAPKFEFYFAGRNMPDEFRNMRLSGVHCLDEVPDAGAFIADKKILIVPLRSGGGIRVKILEAMAAGKIVITTNIGIKGIDARAGEHFLLVKKHEDFAKNIKWCLDNKAAAQEMAQKARELMKEKYDQAKVMGDVLSEVERLLALRHDSAYQDPG